MKFHPISLSALAAFAVSHSNLCAAPIPETPPDLTKDLSAVDRTETYNLDPAGLRGWIYTRAASHLDSLQGRTTTAKRGWIAEVFR